MSKEQLFAAVWSDIPTDKNPDGYCDEWVEVYTSLAKAIETCQVWATKLRSDTVRIFLAKGLNLDGKYGEEIASW